MSVHMIYYKDGAKMMRPILTREEYLNLRGSDMQKAFVKAVREGNDQMKLRLMQMNYSCLPNEDGSLKGSKTMSMTVGMDIDHIAAEELTRVKEGILGKKEELGLLMLEKSARGAGYHLVFRRKPELSQEENLRWASEVLGVEFDKGAKDITRVFFTTTDSEEDLIYLDDEVFDGNVNPNANLNPNPNGNDDLNHNVNPDPNPNGNDDGNPDINLNVNPDLNYKGILFTDIIAKYWEMFNDGKEPVEGDRNVLTFELAVTLRSICGYSMERMMQVIPNYWGTQNQEDVMEWKRTIESALKEPKKGMPFRLRQVLTALKSQPAVRACGGTLTTPPPMPKRLPPLVKLLTKNVPLAYKPAVASAVFPALGAHLHGVKFRYWDNVEHEATFMNVLIGRQSIGKGAIKKHTPA